MHNLNFLSVFNYFSSINVKIKSTYLNGAFSASFFHQNTFKYKCIPYFLVDMKLNKALSHLLF